jgi:hypothetical protein
MQSLATGKSRVRGARELALQAAVDWLRREPNRRFPVAIALSLAIPRS